MVLLFLECDQGTFGWNCSQICGHCSKKNDCNKVNGSCPAGCEPGFKDDLCNAGMNSKFFLWRVVNLFVSFSIVIS